MFNFLKSKINATASCFKDTPDETISSESKTPLSDSLTENLVALRAKYQNSSDFLTRELTINGVKLELVMVEGMINLQVMTTMILNPLLNEKFDKNATNVEIYDFIETKTIMAADMKDVYSHEEIFQFIMSGFIVILIDGLNKAIAFGVQGFNFRSISEPESEVNERGSREGFTEPLRINMTMVRRRIKSPTLKFELFSVGKISKTDICMMYMTDKVSQKLLNEVRGKIKKIDLDIILTSGYIQPFLEGKPWSLFSDVGTTERPDVLAGKINEGRIAIVVDGTPYALIVPYLFSENFQSLDDYSHGPVFASFTRLLKYFSFLLTLYLPALYVGIATFHPELLPHSLLFNIAAAEEITPFPLVIEALIIHILYEIMREAGLRLPRPIGHAVSIVGALVIGDAAVTAGLIGSPMVLIIAATAIASFVVPKLYEAVSVLRLAFIIIAGTMGLYGIALASIILLVNICSLTNFRTPYMSPISPFSLTAMRDTFIRLSFLKLQQKNVKIQNLKGVNIDSSKEE